MEIKISKQSERRIEAIKAVNSLAGEITDESLIVDQIIEKYYQGQKESLAEKVLEILGEPAKKAPKKKKEFQGPKSVVITDQYGRDIVFESVAKAAKHIGVSASAVSFALHGTGETKGFKVRFKEDSPKGGIVVLDARGKECGVFRTQKEAAEFVGVHPSTFSMALQKGSKVNGFSAYERIPKANLDKMNY